MIKLLKIYMYKIKKFITNSDPFKNEPNFYRLFDRLRNQS